MDTIKSWQSLVQVSNKLQEESATKFEDTKDAIQDKIKQVKMSEEEYAKYQAIQKLASNATEEQKEAVRKLVDKLYDLRKAQDEANEETKDEIDPVREVTERMRDKRNELIMSEERYAKYKAVKKADIALDSEAAKKIREKIDAYYDLKRAQQSQQDSKDISLEFENVKSKTDNIWQEMKMGGRSMFQDLEKSANNWAKNTKQIMQSTTGAMSDALTDFIMTGEMQWKDFTQMVVKQITQIMMQYLMLQAIKTAAGIPGMPSISSASAQGNVFSDGKVQPFAKGGVVDQPTVFPMANGAGLMGEKGPEAVMPLTRTSGGDLGVKTEEGGGKKVQQNFNIQVQTGPDGKIAQESQQQMSRKLFRTMKNAERRN